MRYHSLVTALLPSLVGGRYLSMRLTGLPLDGGDDHSRVLASEIAKISLSAPMNLFLLNRAYIIGVGLAVAALIQAAEPYQATIDQDGVQRVQVLGGEYFFKPKHIVVKAHIPVELWVRREPGMVPHNVVIKASEANINIVQALSPEPKIIRFIPITPGRYVFYCSKKLLFFPSHREKGMEGILEVVK